MWTQDLIFNRPKTADPKSTRRPDDPNEHLYSQLKQVYFLKTLNIQEVYEKFCVKKFMNNSIPKIVLGSLLGLALVATRTRTPSGPDISTV